MMADNRDSTVTIGKKNLDNILDTRGIPAGQMGTLVSSPSSSAYHLILEMISHEPDKKCYLTNTHNVDSVLSDMSDRYSDFSTKPDIRSIHNMGVDEVIELVGDMNTDDLSTIVIDTIERVDDQIDIQMFNTLKNIARESDLVILLHNIESQVKNEFSFDMKDLIYSSDFVFTMMKRRVEQSLRQQFTFHKTPNGSVINQNITETPIVGIEYLDGTLSIDAGGRL
jgi:hypothetical protein